MSLFKQRVTDNMRRLYAKDIYQGNAKEIYTAFSEACMEIVEENWTSEISKKRACYLSAEFLIGRVINSNLFNLGILHEANELLKENGISENIFEEIDDDALGNGGLGRLAACFLDSAATHSIPLDGYGIRYKYGIFKQKITDGFQKEYPDDWTRFGDPFSIRKEDESVKIRFADQSVTAVPYDMPIIGYKNKTVNTLRLWQSEADSADKGSDKAVKAAEEISGVLYPNDNDEAGKILRLKQQYFFTSATMQCLVKRFKENIGGDFKNFPDHFAVQLNDTHPTIAIPELIRILIEDEGMSFDCAFDVAVKTFAYTNHTVMIEALEKWDVGLFRKVVPKLCRYVEQINDRLLEKVDCRNNGSARDKYGIISGGNVHMARLAIFASHSTNGVAKLHTEILKNSVLKNWYELFPERFNNKTNGITQRRWLGLCNPQLSEFITERIGDKWIYNLYELEKLKPFACSKSDLENFIKIKREKKNELKEYVQKHDGFIMDPSFVVDIQVKRLHEYKRQLLNAFSIMYFYFGLKDKSITLFRPTVFIFGAKAAPGYARAKGIIKYINEVAELVNSDSDVNDKMQVLFVSDYNVSYAEKLIPAADISEQISTAGTEASGTSNMKFMLNGAVTLGTLDGANIEIVNKAGKENNYIFGATVEEIEKAKNNYAPERIYKENKALKKVVDTLIDGTFDDGGTGIFKELHDSLLKGASWHSPDNYFLFLDFDDYCKTKLRAINDTANEYEFAKKCILNIAGSGEFSSDRTVYEYAKEIWNV